MALLVLAILSVILLIALSAFRRKRVFLKLDIPYPDGFPFITGLFYPILKLAFSSGEERFRVINEYSERYPDMVKLWLGSKFVIIVSHPDRIKKLLMSSKCLDKMNLIYRLIERKSGLIAARTEHKWKEHRKFFNFSFNLKIIARFLQIFVECSESLVDNIQKEAEMVEFNFIVHAKRVCFDMLCGTTLGVNIEEHRKQPKNEKIFDAFETTERAFNHKTIFPFLYPETFYKLTSMYRAEQKARKLLNEFQEKMFEERRCELNASKSTHKFDDGQGSDILIDHIILNEEKFSADEIRDHIYTFLQCYEVLSNGLAHAMLLIAMHPEAQAKLYDEIQGLIITDEDLKSSERINKLQYLDVVLKETFRLLPTVPMILRETSEDFPIEPGLMIPKDTNLVFNFYALHRRKDIWGEDAEEFKPERFLPDNSTNRPQFAYLPFSAGPRICIAYKYSTIALKVAITRLVQSFEFKTSMKMSDIRLKSFVSLKLCTPHLMSVTKRNF